MNNTLLKICIGGLIGIGGGIGTCIGIEVGKYKIDELEVERNMLELQNLALKGEYEILQMVCDNLKENNKLFTKILMEEKMNEET